MTKSLAEFPFAKILLKIEGISCSFKEQKIGNQNVAIICIKPTKPEMHYNAIAVLECILPAQEELKRFDLIKISIDSLRQYYTEKPSEMRLRLGATLESFAYFYNFIKKTPDFNLNIYLGAGTPDGFDEYYQELVMNRISFFREQRQVWLRLKNLSKESKAISPGANICALFTFINDSKKFDPGYCLPIIRELEFKESKQVESIIFFKCLKVKDDFNSILDLAGNAHLGRPDLCLFSFIPDTGTQHLILFSNNKVILIYDSLNDKRVVESTLLGKSIDEVLATPTIYICSLQNATITPFSEYKKIDLMRKSQDIQNKHSLVLECVKNISLEIAILKGLGNMFTAMLGEPAIFKKYFTEKSSFTGESSLDSDTVKSVYDECYNPYLHRLETEYEQKVAEQKQYETQLDEVKESLKALSILQQPPSITPTSDLALSLVSKK